MFSDDVLARLSQLNRQRLAVPDGGGASTTEAGQPDTSSSNVSAQSSPPQSSLATTDLPSLDADDEDVSQLPAGEEITNVWGTHWVRRRSLRQLWPHGDHWLRHSLIRMDQSRENPPTRSRELRALLDNLPNHVMYLDLETCGFSGSMVFLVGLIHRHEDDFELVQLMARNYAEEKAMLQSLWSIAADNRVLATFNGKSFDWPMVHDRSTLHHLGYDTRLVAKEQSEESQKNRSDNSVPEAENLHALTRHDPRPQLTHCDLLHHARRRWKKKLPDCKLQTLERLVCRRHRTDDIPGREIPTAYHDFVRSGDAWLIRSVLHHNALDLVTLLQLSMMLIPADGES